MTSPLIELVCRRITWPTRRQAETGTLPGITAHKCDLCRDWYVAGRITAQPCHYHPRETP